ncbi:LutC/YkgG family protein [Hymenobacter sediminicola]|uniref:LUD domain-containing protein n=1 Tax=Hymenobacter sediminicola TaxID=2761579 RepID=A0A7G7WAY1_9BACT|nr:LUD domain-containing protein [Hymenobacter sediminicola]QNH63524.1 LUD domain-containing protein [Hymenobacter sediminicola]
MSSREKILAAVTANQPAKVPLPTVPFFEGDASVEKFTTLVQAIGGRVVEVAALAHLEEVVRQLFPADYRVASPLLSSANVSVDAQTPLAVLADVELAVLQGEFGVAENGAIWLPEENMLHRALPMITQHLALVLSRQQLVATMHQAYARLATVGGYGTFLAGPSKTADIEQSLVIGAHGARSLTVLLVP